MTRHLRVLVLFALTLSAARAAEPEPLTTDSAPMTCALIADKALGFDQSPTFALIEAGLAQQPRLALVERTQIAKITQEAMLQRAFSPEGSDARRQLGGLLKARLLVVLRASEKQVAPPGPPAESGLPGQPGQPPQTVRSLHVMIADTVYGLRILTTDHVWDDKQPQEAADSLRQDVERALAKLTTPLRAIVAVPPFVCDDFTFGYSFLKGAYAELLIQSFDRAPGVLTVEIAEARAIAAERGLAGDDALRRPLLSYFLEGSYRSKGRGDERRVQVSVRLQREGQPPKEIASDDLAPAAVPPFLQNVSGNFIKEMLQIEPPPFDADREVTQMDKRIGELERLGDYEEGVRLIEVASMIKPSLPVYERAVSLASKLANQLHNPYMPESYAVRARKTVDASLLALDNLKRAAAQPGFDPMKSRALMEQACGCGSAMFQTMSLVRPPELAQGMGDLAWGRRDFIISQVERMDAEGNVTSATYGSLSHLVQLAESPFPLSGIFRGQEARRLDGSFRMIRVCYKINAPGCSQWLCHMILRPLVTGTPESQDLLDRVAALPGRRSKVIAAHFRLLSSSMDAAQKVQGVSSLISYVRDSGLVAEDLSLLNYLQFMLQALGGPKMTSPPLGTHPNVPGGPPVGRLRFVSVPEFDEAVDQYYRKTNPLLRMAQPPPKGRTTYMLYGRLRGCASCRDGTDAYWTNNHEGGDRIFLVRRAGSVEPLYECPNGRIYSVVYDGRYLWAYAADWSGGAVRLVVIDPESGQTQTVKAADGLPPGDLWIAPVSPGRICVIGSFGRTWCAIAQCEVSGRASVEVFHEAALSQGPADDLRVAFRPALVVTLPESPTSTRPCVLVVKGPQAFLIDPNAKTLKALPFTIQIHTGPMTTATHDGAFYWLESLGGSEMQMWKVAGPEWKKQRVMYRVPGAVTGTIPAHLVFMGEHCLLTGPKAWLVNLKTGGIGSVDTGDYQRKVLYISQTSFVATQNLGMVTLPALTGFYRVEFEAVTSQPAPAAPPLTDGEPKSAKKYAAQYSAKAAAIMAENRTTSPVTIPPFLAAEFAIAENPPQRRIPVPPETGPNPPIPPFEIPIPAKAGTETAFGRPAVLTLPPNYLPKAERSGPDGTRPVIWETTAETVREGSIHDETTAETMREGSIHDEMMGRPIPGAMVFAASSAPPLHALCFTKEQWAKLRALPLEQLRKIGSGQSDPELQSLDRLKSSLSFSSAVRTDAQGRYRVSMNVQEGATHVVVVAENYIPCCAPTESAGASIGRIMWSPLLRLHPSAVVSFRPVAAQRLKLQLYLIGDTSGFLSYGPVFFFPPPPPGKTGPPLPPNFFPMMAPRLYTQNREAGRTVATEPSPIWTNEDCRCPVPAGLQMTLELRGHSMGAGAGQSVRSAVLARDVMLKQGESFDVGEVRLETGN